MRSRRQQTWSAWGGQIGIALESRPARAISASPSATRRPASSRRRISACTNGSTLRQSGGLQFTVSNCIAAQVHRRLAADARRLRAASCATAARIDLRDLTLRARTDGSNVLDLVSGDGKVWFYSDSLMFRLADDERGLEVMSANLRMSQALANRIGVPEAAGWNLGDIAMNTEIFMQGADLAPDRVCNPYPWPDVAVPGVPGAVYKADLFMQATQYDPTGCMSCDGPGGNDGIASVAPTSTLRNNVNDGTAQPTIPGDPLGTSANLYTANVAWHTMFSGSNPPYNNDQHPFLIWNMYRFNADGSFEQIGRSGVKHAFVTINAGCLDSCNELRLARPRLRRHLRQRQQRQPRRHGSALGNRAGHRHLGPLRLDLGCALHRQPSTTTATSRGRSACRCTNRRSIPRRMPARPT